MNYSSTYIVAFSMVTFGSTFFFINVIKDMVEDHFRTNSVF